MNERERLIAILEKAPKSLQYEDLPDYLLENGVVVLERDRNDFNRDLYCPYCGNNLSNTKVFEQALKGGAANEAN